MSPMKAAILDRSNTQDYEYKDSIGVRGLLEERMGEALAGLVTNIPLSVVPFSENPHKVSVELIQKASASAAVQSGMLALPGGPLGIITILPDLMNIWRIQSQLISDIAAAHGKTAYLGHKEMAWCLFRHAATQIARDFVVRAGQRALIAQIGQRTMTAVMRKVGARSVERISGRLLLRFIPLLGMAVSGGYAWWDTREVGKTAISLFGHPQHK